MSDFSLVGVGATTESVQLFAAVLHGAEGPPPVTIRFEGERVDCNWHRRPIGSNPGFLWWSKPAVSGLAAGRYYSAELVDADEGVVAAARVATLPKPGAVRFQLVVGSCFDVLGSHASVLDRAYDVLTEAAAPDISYNLWLGDQVYVDAPWAESTRATDARRTIYDRYLRSWGLRTESGLARVMRDSTNWYLPDDHEFWNGYPDPSWLTLFWHTFKRFSRQVWRAASPLSHSLPHPASQGEWGSTAGEAYCVFASDVEFDTFDESVSPPGLRRIEFDDVVVAMVDTRWRRTIRKSLPGAGFMLEDDLDELVELLENETKTVCLALSRPIVGFLPRRSVSRGATDAGPEMYKEQYTRLWRALSHRAAAGRPTLTVAGDVHRHAVRGALDERLLEVVSSPLSILEALDRRSLVNRIRRTLAAIRRTLRMSEVRARGLETEVECAYPVFGSEEEDDWTPAAGSEIFLAGPDTSGVAGIEFDTTNPGRPEITVRTVVEPEDFGETLHTSMLRYRWEPDTGWVPA